MLQKKTRTIYSLSRSKQYLHMLLLVTHHLSHFNQSINHIITMAGAKRLTLHQKLNNTKKRLDRILCKYDNNRDYIVMKVSDYRRSKDSNLKAIYNDYQSLLRAEKVIHQISNEIIDESSSFDEN
jgi:hypothetical protein